MHSVSTLTHILRNSLLFGSSEYFVLDHCTFWCSLASCTFRRRLFRQLVLESLDVEVVDALVDFLLNYPHLPIPQDPGLCNPTVSANQTSYVRQESP